MLACFIRLKSCLQNFGNRWHNSCTGIVVFKPTINRRKEKLAMKLIRYFALYTMVFCAGLLACDGDGGSSNGTSGTVSMSLTDSATDDYLAVYVTIADVQICRNDSGDPDAECGWKSLEAENGGSLQNKTYNLLDLVNGVTEAIGSKQFAAGRYNQIRLMVGDSAELENNILGAPHPYANYVILNDGSNTAEELKIPSGFQTGIKLVHPFEVIGDQVKELVLDFDADRSVVKAGNSGKYILKPTVKVLETENKIGVYGVVTDDSETPAPIGNARVSAQISDGLSATVIRAAITESAAAENGLEAGEYLLSLLSPDQTYNLVVYRDHVDGEQSVYSPECVAFRYNDAPDLEPLMDFILSNDNHGIGTISGVVTVNGGAEPDFPLTVTVYTELDCGREDGEGYVEITKADIIADSGGDTFEYSVKLPIYDSSVTYYVVASADGYVPVTSDATLSAANPDAVDVDLEIQSAE